MARTKIADIPNFIHCSITGKRFAVRREVLLVRIKGAGSFERLQKTYVSREARKLLKSGKTVEQIRALLGHEIEYANNNLTDHAAKTSSSMARVRTPEGEEVDAFWRQPGWVTPKPGHSLGKTMTDTEIMEDSKSRCFYPNRWLDHDCKNCQIFHLCQLLTKGVYRK